MVEARNTCLVFLFTQRRDLILVKWLPQFRWDVTGVCVWTNKHAHKQTGTLCHWWHIKGLRGTASPKHLNYYLDNKCIRTQHSTAYWADIKAIFTITKTNHLLFHLHSYWIHTVPRRGPCYFKAHKNTHTQSPILLFGFTHKNKYQHFFVRTKNSELMSPRVWCLHGYTAWSGSWVVSTATEAVDASCCSMWQGYCSVMPLFVCLSFSGH